MMIVCPNICMCSCNTVLTHHILYKIASKSENNEHVRVSIQIIYENTFVNKQRKIVFAVQGDRKKKFVT